MKLLFYLWILPVTLGDTHITCVYSKECILPCTSKNLDIIHWNKDKKPVHSFYHNQDQLDYQAVEYKDRTSLFSESEIKKGNISLLLKNIKVQDEGTYKCYAANEKLSDEKLISVSVEAPVTAVDITLKDDTVICKTSGVYPEPDVSWSSSTPAENTFRQTEENLFTVISKLTVDAKAIYSYECSIMSKDKTKTLYTAKLEQQEVNDEFFVKCPVTKDLDYTLTLSFSDPILTYDSKKSMKEIPEQWRGKVTFHPENGTVKLSDLNNEHSGTYTCECTTAHHRYITKTVVVPSGGGEIVIITSILLAIFAIVATAAIVLVIKYKKKKSSRKPAKTTEIEISNKSSANGKASEPLNPPEKNGEQQNTLSEVE